MFTSPMSHQLVQSTATVADTASRYRQRSLHPFLREEVSQRSDRVRVERGGGHNMEKGAWQHMLILISTNKRRKSHSSYLVLVNWKLPYVVFGVYYILIPICPCFCWLTVLHACE